MLIKLSNNGNSIKPRNYLNKQGSRNLKKVGSQQKFLVANKNLAPPPNF